MKSTRFTAAPHGYHATSMRAQFSCMRHTTISLNPEKFPSKASVIGRILSTRTLCSQQYQVDVIPLSPPFLPYHNQTSNTTRDTPCLSNVLSFSPHPNKLNNAHYSTDRDDLHYRAGCMRCVIDALPRISCGWACGVVLW
jgi:hypothetical protein